MKVYIDSMLVKLLKSKGHILDLQETFAVFRKYNMKLNPTKYAFGVTSGKFLRFMVTSRELEPIPKR